MLGLEQTRLQFAKTSYENYLETARIDRTRAVDDQDRSQAEQSGVLAAAFDCPIHTHEETIKKLSALEFGEKDEIESGAVVKFNNRNFVISVATDAFTCQGEEFIGISEEAPIFHAMAGLSADDSFSFNDQEFQLDAVY